MAVATKVAPTPAGVAESRMTGLIAQAVERLGALAMASGGDGARVETAGLHFELRFEPAGGGVASRPRGWQVIVRMDAHDRNGVWIERAPVQWRMVFAKGGAQALAAVLRARPSVVEAVDTAADELAAWLQATDPEGV